MRQTLQYNQYPLDQPVVVKQTSVGSVAEKAHYDGCCSDAVITCSSDAATLILITKIILPRCETARSAWPCCCKNEPSCKWAALCLSFGQSITAWCFIGLIWSIWSGTKNFAHSCPGGKRNGHW